MTLTDLFGAWTDALAAAAAARWARLLTAGADLAELPLRLTAAGWPPARLAAAVAAVALASAGGIWLARRLGRAGAAPHAGPPPIGSEPAPPASVVRWGLALAAGFLCGAAAAHALAEPGPVRGGLLVLAALPPLVAALRAGLDAALAAPAPTGSEPARLGRLSRDLGAALVWTAAGVGALAVLRTVEAGAGLRDLVATLFFALPVTALVAAAYARSGVAVARALRRRREPRRIGGPVRARRLRVRWPRVAIGIVVGAFLFSQLVVTLNQPLPGGPAVATLILLLLAPHFDVRIRAWAERGLAAREVGVAPVAARRTARPAVAAAILAAAASVWLAPVAGVLGVGMEAFHRPLVAVAAIGLVSAFLWNVVGVAVERVLALEAESATAAPPRADGGDAEATAPLSRLQTLVPLVAGVAQIAILALALLTALLALGVNVWPLVTGLSVFGLAIGFGSQALVRDIVSGLFFLLEDAFRVGEYVEVAGSKGAVERLSVRSLSLRHPRGAVATVPYGRIDKVLNHSRDWVIVKLEFRVAFDTDVDKLRKLFKEIGRQLTDNPDFAGDLLEPFKSQGIFGVEDGTLIVRAKFKARPGRQFALRRAALAAVQKAFRDNGIEAVGRPIAFPAPAAA